MSKESSAECHYISFSEPVLAFGAAGLVSRRESSAQGAATVFYLFDPQGNPVHRLDESGNVLTSHLFSAHGTQVATGPVGHDPFAGYKSQLGYYTDQETGLVLCTFRYYDPATGRFLTRDPLGYAGGINLYGYCGNDVVNAADPMGLDWLDTAANFSAGFGDSLTFGLTGLVRESLGVNDVVDKNSSAYIVGEWTEVAVEMALTGGSAGLRHAATRMT